MRLTLDPEDLAGTVGWVAGIIPGRAADPITAGMRLDAAAGELTVSASDYETTGRAASPANVTRGGSAVVPGRFFADVVKTLPREPVTVELDGSLIVVECSAARFTVPALPPGTVYPEFPALPVASCSLPAADFAAAAAAAAAAVSTDASLPVLTGVRAEFSAGTLALVGTDRYRMTVTVVPCTAESGTVPAPVTVPGRILAGFAKSAHGDSVTVGVSGSSGAWMIGFSDATRQVMTRSIAGEFPPWRSKFAQPPAFSIIVDAGLLAAAVRRCSVAADTADDAVRLTFSGGHVHVGLSRGDGASATETVPGVIWERGGEFVILFKPEYLVDALAGAGSKHVRLGVRNASGAVLFTCAPDGPGPDAAVPAVGDEPYRCLLAPKQPSS